MRLRLCFVVLLFSAVTTIVSSGETRELEYGDTLHVPSGTVATFVYAAFDLGGYAGGALSEIAVDGVSTGGVILLPATRLDKVVETVRVGLDPRGTEGSPSNAPFMVTGPIDVRLVVEEVGTLTYDAPLTNTSLRCIFDRSVSAKTVGTWPIRANGSARIESSEDLREWHTTQAGLFGTEAKQFFRTRGCGVSMEPIVGKHD